MKSARVIAMRLAVLLLVCASASHAQFWQKKDSSKWSMEECDLLVRNSRSPWVSTHAIGMRLSPNLPSQFQGWDGPNLSYKATILSAWTVKRAYFRMAQITTHHMELPAKDKSTVEPQLKQAFPDTVVFRVEYQGTPSMVLASKSFFQAQTQVDLLRHITLVADGKRIQPLKVAVDSDGGGDQSGGFQVVFPRQLEGGPLLTPDMKIVYLEIADPSAKVRLPFNVKRMVVNGEVVY